MSETDEAFETIRAYILAYAPHGRPEERALAALASLRQRQEELEAEQGAMRSAWSDTALELGLDPDYSGDDIAPAVNALRTQLQQAEQERDALRSAWSDAGLVLGLDVDFSDDDITPAITDLRLQLQQAEARLGQLEGLLGIAARWLDEDDEQMHRALAADIRQALASSNTDPKGTFIDMHDGGEDYFIPADPKEG
jgi:hypothetical protein